MGGKPRAFKHQLGATQVERIATALADVAPAIDRARFVRDAGRGLAAMELKDRVRHIIACLHRALPQPFPRAIAVIVAAARSDERQLRGFAAWPLIDYVGAHGLDHVDEALSALRELTERFSAEFAIRPFLRHHPEPTLRRLHRWTLDPNEHVRRLVSEGTRPLLPWGERLQRFRDDPEPVLALLERLKGDTSEYVRRSVANNLNDIAKDHPERVVAICAAWSMPGDVDRVRLLRRALRSLIKAGHAGALAVLGYDTTIEVAVAPLRVVPAAVRTGQSVELETEIRSTSNRRQRLSIDYAVHFVKANGKTAPKVFKLKPVELGAGARIAVRKRHSMKAVTTRAHYPGTHTVELLINGHSLGTADFELLE